MTDAEEKRVFQAWGWVSSNGGYVINPHWSKEDALRLIGNSKHPERVVFVEIKEISQ